MDLIFVYECRFVFVVLGNILFEVNDFLLKVEGLLCWVDD